MKNIIPDLLAFSGAMIIIVIGFLWFLGRAKDFKERNDKIYENKLK
jgi:TM2 domain-containing membrane protein YozV